MIERDQKKSHQSKRRHTRSSSMRLRDKSIAGRKFLSANPSPGNYYANSTKIEPAGQSNSMVRSVFVPDKRSGMLNSGIKVGEIPPRDPENLIDMNNQPTDGKTSYTARGNGMGVMNLTDGGIKGVTTTNVSSNFEMVEPQVMNSSKSNVTAPTESLFTFNILCIDQKINPLLLPLEQQHLMQTAFLKNLRSDQAITNALRYNCFEQQLPNQCLNCMSNLTPDQMGKQLCPVCQQGGSVIHLLNQFLTILKLNRRRDLYKVILLTRIPLNHLLKSSMTADCSYRSVLNKLYDKFITPINDITGAEFVFVNSLLLTPQAAALIPKGVIKQSFRCTKDISTLKLVTNDNIDPEALKLEKIEETQTEKSSTIKPSEFPAVGCQSLINLSYDTRNGDLTICFSHRKHK